MKFYALNGSPRKNWNDAQLLEKFKEGILSVLPDAEVETINVYDYNFTGCRSCFACKLRRFENEPLRCRIKDDIYELLDKVRNSDGFVMASPIYFCDLSGQLRCFLERLMYPGATPKELPVSCIYTMNADEEAMEQVIRPALNVMKSYLKANFKTDPEEVFAFDTLQRNHNELYKKGHTDMEAKAKRHETQWPIDLKAAFDAGVRFAKKAAALKEEE
jgi:multimeric flavodoxin WrbA